MKLFYTKTSPYARKVRMAILEKGVEQEVELALENPFQDSPALMEANPLNKVPCLVTGDVGTVFDSRVICRYLDSAYRDPPLVPQGDKKWPVLIGESKSDGILDAAFAIVMERLRSDAEQSSRWLSRWQGVLQRTLNSIEADMSGFVGPISVAQIGLGSALAYLDFRLPERGWRDGRPNLNAWFLEFSNRPSFVETTFSEG